jgi:hypothetical protein
MNTAKLFSLKPHPFSMIFPAAHGQDRQHLLESVRKLKRLRFPVIVFENMILDGNQRLSVCREARIEPKFTVFEGTAAQALDMVWDLNMARRQLNASEKATAVAKATLMFESGDRSDLSASGQVTDKLAKKAGVGRSTVYDAKTVLRHGTNNEIKALETGEAKAKPLAAAIRKREAGATGTSDLLDENGVSIPIGAREYWNRRPEANNVLNQIRAAKGQVKKLLADDPMWAEVNLNGVLADLGSASNRFAAAVPAYVCPYCKGKAENCKSCKGRGVVSKFMWSMMPEEIKNKPF